MCREADQVRASLQRASWWSMCVRLILLLRAFSSLLALRNSMMMMPRKRTANHLSTGNSVYATAIWGDRLRTLAFPGVQVLATQRNRHR